MPMDFQGAGLIILEHGNVICRGNRLPNQLSALTIVAPEAETVTFEQSDLHHLNVLAPRGRLVLAHTCRINGSVDVRDTLQSGGGKGGSITWREIQDPTRETETGPDSRVF